MPTFVNGSEGGGLPAEPAAPYDQLIAEEVKRTRAASDGDARPSRGRPRQFSVVAVDESRTTTVLPPPHLLPSSTGRGSSGAAFPAEAPPLAATVQVTSNGINGHAKTDVSFVPETIGGGGEGGSGGLPASAAASIACGQLSAAGALAAYTDHPTSIALSELVLPIPAAVGGGGSSSSNNASDGQSSSSGSPKPKGSSSRGGSAAATTAAAADDAAVADESTPSLADEQATISAGVQHRIHYRKLREKPGSTPDAEQLSGGAKMDRLTVPTAASYHHSLPAAGQWNYPALLGAAAAPAPRNISTLSLTLLLRDQRRKNLAMLARLFASRQKEKDLLDGTQTSYQELMSESKRKRCRVTSMQVAVASLFCILVALVTTSVLLFGPNRNIYRSQPGFVFDKDTRLLTVHNSSGYPLLQIRTGIDLRGLPYNCSTPDDLRNRRRCWKWSPANATLRVNVVNLSSELTCVDVTWQTTSSDPILHDCIALGGMQWYGGTSSRSLPWSLNSAVAAMTIGLATTSALDEGPGPGGAVLYAPGSTLGALAARAWLSSSAALVAAGGYAPLFFRLRGSSGPGGPAFCLSSYYGSRSLNYTACVGVDVPTVHRRLIESQRATTAWTSDDGPAAVAIDELGTTPSSPAAITQDDSHEDAGSGTTHTGALSPDDEPSDGFAPAAAAAATTAAAATVGVPASASRARWSSAIVRPDPVWIVRTDSGADLLRQVVAHKFATGVLLIRESALSDPGRVKEAISNLTSEALLLNVTGLSLGLTVSAFVGVRSELFLDGRNEKLWTRSARSSLPMLVRDGGVVGAPDGGGASVLVDPASELARELLGHRLREIADVSSSSGGGSTNLSSSTIGMLYLRAAIAAADLDLEAYSSAAQERLLSYPLWYARFGFDLLHSSLALGKDAAASTTLLVDGATSGLAGYTLSESVRQGSLADIVTHMLAASVGGDPPSSVGPFAAVEAAAAAANGGGMDSRHRYIRWMQLAAFAPVMLFDSVPWEHGADVVAISRRVLEFRQAEIVPRLRRLYEAFGRTGEPVYKPLWWNDSVAAGAKTSKLSAQFFLDDLLVAPVVDQRPYRLIYFPTGFWLDRGQRLFIGPGTHNYTVDLDSIPCFVRKTTGIHEQGITEADVGSSRR